MKFAKYFQSMYYVTIALLLLLAAVASVGRGFPVNLVIAVAVASGLDVAIKKVILKRRPSAPLSAIISGLIIGSVAPLNAPYLLILLASTVAILSKYALRWKGQHIFNPAALGLLIGLATFALGDEWWAAGASYAGITLTPLLILANYKAGKLWTSISFLAVTAILLHFTGLTVINSLSGTFRFLDSLPYYFGFIMVSEPRTSPYVRNEQIAFGAGVAVLSVVLVYTGFYAQLAALLLGNLVYALYKSRKV